MPAGDPLTYFVDAERALEKGITELAGLGADKETTDLLGEISDELRSVITALGKGQHGTGDAEPAAPATMDEGIAQMHAQTQAVPEPAIPGGP